MPRNSPVLGLSLGVIVVGFVCIGYGLGMAVGLVAIMALGIKRTDAGLDILGDTPGHTTTHPSHQGHD